MSNTFFQGGGEKNLRGLRPLGTGLVVRNNATHGLEAPVSFHASR